MLTQGNVPLHCYVTDNGPGNSLLLFLSIMLPMYRSWMWICGLMGYNGALRAVTVWRSGQHTLDQPSQAGYLLLHGLHALQAMIPWKVNTTDGHVSPDSKHSKADEQRSFCCVTMQHRELQIEQRSFSKNLVLNFNRFFVKLNACNQISPTQSLSEKKNNQKWRRLKRCNILLNLLIIIVCMCFDQIWSR